MGKFKRARSDQDKLRRRETILRNAWQLYEKTGGQLPTVSHIARKARLSKGAIYLYFRTKEEIYLQLFVEKLREWVQSRNITRDPGLAGLRLTEEEFASLITEYIRDNPLVLKLGSIVKGVLEENTDEDVVIETKIQIAEILSASGDYLSEIFPEIPRSESVKLMLQIYSVISGLWQFAVIPERTKKALHEKGIDAFEFDFSDLIQKSVTALIRGTISG